jgi:starch-binding outer membrane protein SusE/F
MKYFKNLVWLMLLSSSAVIIGCDDEQDLNLNLTEVKNLLAPEDNITVELKPSQNLSMLFQWDQARAEDGSLVLYEVVFDHEDGDFSSPFYTTVSDGKGVENKLTLTHANLNTIATMGGADFFEKKKFKWTVLASKGSNVKITAQSKMIELERPGGFAVLPSDLFLTGSSTEGGAEISQALKMKQTNPGEFEIYTKLTAGTYKFVDGLTPGARIFYINDDDGFKVVGTDNENTHAGPDKNYRIKINFNSLSVNVDEVKSVGFWYCWENKILYDLNYAGKGVWRIDGVTVNLSTVPWGLEERHKYKVVLNDGVQDKEEWWGYIAGDSPGQDGKYGQTDPAYFHAYLIENSDQWNHAWKLDRPAIQGKVVDFVMKFSGDAPYASEYIIH